MALASHRGLPTNSETIDEHPFPVPDPPFMQETHSTTGSNLDGVQTGSVLNSVDINHSGSLNPLNPFSDSGTQDEKGVPFVGDDARDDTITKRSKRHNNSRLWLVASSALFLVLLAIVLGVYFGVTRHHKVFDSSASGSSHPPASSSPSAGSGDLPGSNSTITYGGDGTVVTTDQGTNFTYSNKFGGYFVVDSDDPFNNNARAQSWSPPLNQSWVWGTDQVLG